MTISDGGNTGKGLFTGPNGKIGSVSKDILFVVALVLSSTASFGLGVLAGREGIPGEVRIEQQEAAVIVVLEPEPLPSGGQYVGSKSGTKYYLPWCGTAKRIKDENKVWFATKEDAEKAGYEPGKNCKGL